MQLGHLFPYFESNAVNHNRDKDIWYSADGWHDANSILKNCKEVLIWKIRNEVAWSHSQDNDDDKLSIKNKEKEASKENKDTNFCGRQEIAR